MSRPRGRRRERQERITVEREDFDRRQQDRGTEDVRDHEVILDVLQAVAARDTDGTANRRDDDCRELSIRGLAGWSSLLGGDGNETSRREDEGHGNDGTATQGPLLCRMRLAATGQAPARGIPPGFLPEPCEQPAGRWADQIRGR